MSTSLTPTTKPNHPVCCGVCGHSFRQDPCFEVDCPDCGAKKGQYCKRPSGHQGPLIPFHAARDFKAHKEGYYNHQGISGCGPNVNN